MIICRNRITTAVMTIYILILIGSQNQFLIVIHFYSLENVILIIIIIICKPSVNSDDDDIVIGTPSKVDEVKDLYSPKQNWKISTHIVDTPEQCNKKIVTHSPATDKWTVDKTFETTYNEEPPVKRVLFKDVEDSYKKPGY